MTAKLAIVELGRAQFNDELFGHGTPFLKNAKKPPGLVFVAVAFTTAAVAPAGTAAARVASMTRSSWSAKRPFCTLSGFKFARLSYMRVVDADSASEPALLAPLTRRQRPALLPSTEVFCGACDEALEVGSGPAPPAASDAADHDRAVTLSGESPQSVRRRPERRQTLDTGSSSCGTDDERAPRVECLTGRTVGRISLAFAPQCCSGGKSEVPECLSEGSSRSRLGREPGLTHFSGYFAVW